MPDPAARAWAAAAAVGEWAAAAHRRVGWVEHGRAWTASADAVDAMGRAFEAYAHAMASSRIDAKAAGRAARVMKEAAEMYKSTAEALGYSAEVWRDEADALESAAEAYERSGRTGDERAARKRAATALRSALASAQWESRIRGDAATAERESTRWAANAAKWASGYGLSREHRDELVSYAANERAAVGDERAAAVARAGEAAVAERDSAAAMGQAKEAAEQYAQFMEDAQRLPDAHDAVTAWHEAMASVEKAFNAGAVRE